jgi:iron complex outermembrane receptor protein
MQKALPNRCKLVASLFATVCTLAIGAPALAQASEKTVAADDGFAEVIVTAQKRSQSVQDVGMAISVLTADTLANQNIREITDLASSIPNVQILYGVGQNSFNIRGVGVNVFATNFDPPIATHVDEVYQSKAFMTPLLMFDLDRVEALKGPQGTLFGRNATGGAVNFYTRRPTDHLTAGGSFSYDDYETTHFEGYVSGPLTDHLSARLSGFNTYQGKGYYRNSTTGGTEGWDRKWALRGQLQWKDSKTNVLVSGTYGRDNSQLAPYVALGIFTPASLAAGAPAFCPQYVAGTVTGADANCRRGTDGGYMGTKDPYTTTGNIHHQLRSKQSGLIGRVERDLGWTKLTSISAYQHYTQNIHEDSDASPTDTLEAFTISTIKQYSQELRFSQNKSSRWNYVFGGYFEHDDFSSTTYLTGTAIGPATTGLYTAFTQKVDAAAIFFHNDYALTDHLSLIGGIRYTNETLKVNGGTYLGTGLMTKPVERPTAILATLSTTAAALGGGKRKDDNVSWKVGAEWKPALSSDFVDKLMFYANVSTGFRSGAFNIIFASPQSQLTSLSPEKVTSYEAGFKSVLADRKIVFNGAVFHYDYTNGFINVDSPLSPIPVTINAAAVRSTGAELELQWMPVHGLALRAAGGWLDAKIDSNITASGRSLQGNRPVNSPAWTFDTDGTYTLPLTDRLNLRLSANANYRSSQYLMALNTPVERVQPYWVVGAQVGVSTVDDRWSAALWVKNLTKSKYVTYINDLPGLGLVIKSYGPPRVIGGTVSFKY